MPHERRLSDSEQRNAEATLSLNANKKMVKDKLVSRTGIKSNHLEV